MIPLKLYVSQARSLPTADGGKLKLTPGQFIPYYFSFYISEKGPEADMIASTVSITDSEGTVWNGGALWQVQDFLFQVGSLRAKTPYVDEESAAEDLKSIFKSRLLVDKAKGLLDDRFYRTLKLKGVLYTVPMHYQNPLLDLAVDYSEDLELASLYIRVTNLYGHIGGDEDQVTIPPFIAPVEALDQLFINYYIQDAPGYWTREQIPALVVFKTTSERAIPNSFVIYEP